MMVMRFASNAKENRQTPARSRSPYGQVFVFVQRCLAKIGKQAIEAVQRHGRWCRDFNADRPSVLGVVDPPRPDTIAECLIRVVG